MKLLKINLILLLSMLCITSAFAGGQQDLTIKSSVAVESQKESISDIVTIVDSKGRTVSIAQPVEKVAFSHYAIGDGLKILDAWNLVVAKDSFSSDAIIFPDIDEIPSISAVGSPYDINYEKIFELDPDILITSDLPLPGFEEMIAKIEPDVSVVVLDLQNPEAMPENLIKLGRILGREVEARSYLDWYESVINSIAGKTLELSDEEKTRVLQRTGWGDSTMTFTDEYPGIKYRNTITGSINVAGTLPSQGGFIQSLDPEWLAVQDVDIIINFDIVPKAYGTGIDNNNKYKNYRDTLMQSPLFSNMDAVCNGRFFMIANEFWGTMRNIVGYAYMAKWFHPVLFEGVEPQKVHQEYLTRFMRVDYDLNKHGVFVYPEE